MSRTFRGITPTNPHLSDGGNEDEMDESNCIALKSEAIK